MTQPTPPPAGNNQPESHPSRLSTLLKVGAGVGGLVLVGGVGAALVWGDDLINGQLIPFVETALENTFDRPVELGNLERLTWNGLRLGPSTLPPTDEVETGATVEAVDLTFNWSELLFNRTLRASLTFVEPDINLVQAPDGRWIDITLPDPEEDKTPRPIEFELAEARVENGRASIFRDLPPTASLVEAEPIIVEDLDADVEFLSPAEQDLQEVLFEASGRIEDGAFEIEGDGLLEEQAINLALQATDLPIAGANLFLPPELGIVGGTLNSNLTTELRFQEDNPLDSARGTARLRNGEVRVSQLNEPLRDINSTLRFQGEQVVVEDTSLELGDILLTAAGTLGMEDGYDLTATVPQVSIETVTSLLEVDLPVEAAGDFQFEATVTGTLDQPRLVGQLENLSPVQADQITLETVFANFAATPEQVDLRTLRVVPAAGGFVTARGQVGLDEPENPSLNLDVQADLPGDALAADYGVSLPDNGVIGAIQAEGQVRGSLTDPQATVQFQLAESTYPGSGELTYRNNILALNNARFQVEGGTLNASALAQLDSGAWSADLTTASIPLNRFTDQASGLLTADINASGNLNNLDLQTLQAIGTATVADGVLSLNPESPPLLEPGDWTTRFRWAGNGIQVEQFSAPGVSAAGFIATDLGASPPIDTVDLEVQLSRYNLSRLAQFAPPQVAEQLTLAGLASFDGQVTGPPSNLTLSGNTQLFDLALNEFAFEPVLSGPIDISLGEGGQIDLRGGGDRITATLDQDLLPSQFNLQLGDIIAQGELVNRQLVADVQNFPVEVLGLSPGEALGFGPLAGTLDANLTADLTDFANPSAQGTVTIDSLALGDVVAERFDAEFTYADGLAQLVQGDLQFADSQYQLSGQVNLAAAVPVYDARLDIVSGNFEDLLNALGWETFADIGFRREQGSDAGAAALPVDAAALPLAPFLDQLEAFAGFLARYEQRQEDDTEIALPPLEALEGEFSGTITVAGAGFSPEDIQATVDLQGQDWTWGNFLTCDGLISSDVDAEGEPDTVDLDAPGPEDCNQFELAAQYRQGEFTVEPLLFRADDFLVSFTGSGNLDNLNGQMLVEGLPVAVAEAFIDLPVDLAGQLTTAAQLGGSVFNPTLEGELAIIDPAINRDPLQAVGLDYAYTNAVLSFDGAAVINDPAELTLQGTIPYALPFMTVQPPTDRVDIVVTLEDESLQVLNLVTDDQIRWEGGSGLITVQVGGTLADPAVVGRAEFQDGELTSTALSQPLTNLNGEVLFNLDRVQIDQLQANYGEGTIFAAGRLPIGEGDNLALVAQTKQTQPLATGLAVALEDVNINYEGFIQAELNGEVLVTNSVLNPVVSGDIGVGNGLVRANEMLGQLGSLPNSDLEVPEDPATAPVPEYIETYVETIDGFNPPRVSEPDLPGPLERLRLNNLTLNLTDELVIAGQPFYFINASGDLQISGTPRDLRPRGVITLDNGWINIFSTQFRLVTNAANTATFYPEEGLDPFLDVEMRARVQESDVTRVVTNNPFTSAEISDNVGVTAFGQVEFVTVFASAYGYASALQDSETPSQAGELITLTSRPSRSQEELLALLGESVITNVYSASLEQFAGFLGAGALAGFGDRIANTIGLRSFSIFPTTDLAAESTAGIGIGVEASFQVGDRITIDALEILNSGNPPQVGVSYRFSDQLRTQFTTNFSGDENVSIEYEVRF